MNTIENLNHFLEYVVNHSDIHAKWLNTLSLMENTGARKIAAGEHPLNTDISMLQHAAEEFRHAFYLKKQIAKTQVELHDYSFHNLLNPIGSYHYIRTLDVDISQYLKSQHGLKGRDLIFGAYILVTYAIEVRADDLYPQYEEALRKAGSKITVRPLIFDEQGHLEQIQKQMKTFFKNWNEVAEFAEKAEQRLFQEWMEEVQKTTLVSA